MNPTFMCHLFSTLERFRPNATSCHPGPILDAALPGELGRDLDEGIGCSQADAFAPVRQVAFVEVLEQAAVVEPQIELGVGPQGWLRPGDREQPCLAVREVEPLRVEQRLVGAVGSDRPQQKCVDGAWQHVGVGCADEAAGPGGKAEEPGVREPRVGEPPLPKAPSVGEPGGHAADDSMKVVRRLLRCSAEGFALIDTGSGPG